MSKNSGGRNVWMDIALGNGVALVTALALCAWVTVVRLLGGAAAFNELHASYSQVILVYLASVPVVGTLIGILKPLLSSAVGSISVGSLCAIPVFVPVFVLTGELDWGGVLLCSVGVGGSIGYKFWRDFHAE